MNDKELAHAVHDRYQSNPDDTIDEVAVALEETPDRVTRTLDEWRVKTDGSIEHVGPGGGGGWLDAA